MYAQLKYLIVFVLFISSKLFAQNEFNKWYFGGNAGLDFMTSPPTLLTNGAMNTNEGCAAISNSLGNLLFYTDGTTIWDQTHSQMANGNGLTGNSSTTQSGIIVKQPGNSNIYFVFTLGPSGSGNLNYSVVDMNLSSGNGSVTIKNTLLSGGMTEKLSSVKHCNGVDFWVMAHDNGSANFRAYLVNSSGVSAFPVISTIGTIHSSIAFNWLGNMKFSPNGTKVGLAIHGTTGGFEIYDFNASTGVVSNSLSLATLSSGYGCEFSPDGSKFYGTREGGTNYLNLYQWDLCAGSNTAIVASLATITATSQIMGMQLATDGKIYIARMGVQMLAIINNPNVAGTGCNFSMNGISLAPKTSKFNLPNFITSGFKPPPPPFTFTVSNSYGCQAAAFTSPASVNNFSLLNCSAMGYSLIGQMWNFGDPGSGVNNTSALVNPIHAYTNLGTYTAQVVLYYSCGGGTDTVKQVVVINQPCISVSSTSITCATLGSATVQATGGIGPYSYTWTPSGQTNSVATGLSPGTYTLRVYDFGNNFTYTATTLFTSLIPLSGLVNNSSMIRCNGASTGTANISGLSGGSGSQTYLWTNGVTNYTVPAPTNLSAGNYTYIVTDALTGCNINGGFFINQPVASTVNIAAISTTVCAGQSMTLTGSVTGGSPGFTYTWTGGPLSATYTPTQALAGNYVYSLSTTDASTCVAGGSINITFIANPVLNLINDQICPLQTGTINVLGASSYTWNGLYSGNSFTDNPLSTTQYSVLGASNGCTSIATASIILKSIPVPTLTSNGTRCNGDNLLLNGYGGISYAWTGPSGFNSAVQNSTINVVGLNNAGIYNLTVTAANGCTASTSANVGVNPTPTVSAFGSTICTNDNLTLSANSVAGAGFLWSGPNSFNSVQQNILIPNALNNQSGNYAVKVTSIFGCTNTAVATVSVVSPPNPFIALSSASLCNQALNGSPNSIIAGFTGGSSYTLTVPAYISSSSPFGPSTTLGLMPPNTNTGAVSIHLVASNGVCTNNFTTSFTLVPNPIVNITGPPPVICFGQTFTYNATGAGTYTWQSTDPANVISAFNNSAIVSPTATSVYYVVGSDLGCNSATQLSTLTVNPLPEFTVSPNPALVCIGSTVDLKAIGTTTSTIYNWSPNIFLSSAAGTVVSANPPNTFNYMVLASLNTCTSSAAITVSVLPVPKAVIIAPITTFCAGDSVVLYGSGGNTYQWNGPSNYQASGKEQGFIALSGAFSGIYTLTVSDLKNCKNATTQAITVHDLPQGYLSAKFMEGCVPFCPDLNFKNAGNTSTITSLTWQIDNLVLSGNNVKHCFETPGTHFIKGSLSDANGCANTVTSAVLVHPNPIADFYFNPEQPIEQIDEITFTNGSKDAVDYYWEFGSNQCTSTKKDPLFTFNDIGIYPVALVVRNKWQCSDTMVKAIQVFPDFAVYIPNAFTPNEDGLNETFKPVFSGAKSFAFSIFDRWGEKIFETTDIIKGWDGSYKGQPCKDDVYVWKLQITAENQNMDNSSQQKNLTGSVTLYR